MNVRGWIIGREGNALKADIFEIESDMRDDSDNPESIGWAERVEGCGLPFIVRRNQLHPSREAAVKAWTDRLEAELARWKSAPTGATIVAHDDTIYRLSQAGVKLGRDAGTSRVLLWGMPVTIDTALPLDELYVLSPNEPHIHINVLSYGKPAA